MAADADLTASHSAGLPVEHWPRLLAIVKEYSGELLRIAPELRKYLPGDVYRQADFGLEADYIFRALSAFFIELASLQPICLSFEDLQWADKSSLDLLRHLAAALALRGDPGERRTRRRAWSSSPRPARATRSSGPRSRSFASAARSGSCCWHRLGRAKSAN